MQKFKRIAGFLFLFFIIISTMLYFIQEKLIFLPTKLPQEYVFEFSEPFEEFFLTANDGAKLNGLHFKAEDPKGVLLYFHGNAGDLSRWGTIATFFVQKKYDVIIMDYRTYGKSNGVLSETALFEDAQHFYDYTLDRYAEDEVIIYGRSLGCAIGTQLASNNKAAKLVLETPFYNLYDVAKERFSYLPLKVLLNYKFESNVNIKNVDCPITIFHGTEDTVVPYKSGLRLYDAATSQKEFISIQGGDHNNLVDFSTYQDNIDDVLSVK